MLQGLTTLVLFQFAGEVLARSLGLGLPGPVIGLVLLFCALLARGRSGPELRVASSGLLRHLSMLFVPAGVGVVTQLGALRENWKPVVAAIVVSTALGLAVTGWVMQRLSRGTAQG